MTDFHFHSTFSDGTETPSELAALGAASGLTAMALTDHDSTRGCAEFIREAQARGIKALSGVELSVDAGGHRVHMVGLGFDPENAALNEVLARIRNGRSARNSEILAKLVKNGCAITISDVVKFAGDKNLIARPHFALALMEKGYASSKADAFERYLGKNGCAYCDRYRITPEQAISVVHDAGGVISFAHPYQSEMTKTELREFVCRLSAAGLDGIEAYYTQNTDEMVREYLELAGEFGLIATGGSDHHGSITPGISLGSGIGSFQVPDQIYGGIISRIERIRHDAGKTETA